MTWVNTKEKHPPFHERILCYWRSDKRVVIASGFATVGGEHWEIDDIDYHATPPAYWMPLPEFPKENQP